MIFLPLTVTKISDATTEVVNIIAARNDALVSFCIIYDPCYAKFNDDNYIPLG